MEVGRPAHRGWRHSLGLDPGLYKERRKKVEQQIWTYSLLSVSPYESDVSGSLELLSQ